MQRSFFILQIILINSQPSISFASKLNFLYYLNHAKHGNHMKRRQFIKQSSIGAAGIFAGLNYCTASTEKPNVIVILADDLGYGDCSCLNAESKLKTDHIDSLAAEGMVFTDAHSGSAVCTPTRYGLLTGRYAWRTKLKAGVTWGYSDALIRQDRLTLAEVFKKAGYHTACFGKWHLGLGWPRKPGGKEEDVDYDRPLTDGPTHHGFDTFFGISASLDMPPYVYIQDDRVKAAPDRETEDTGKRFWRKGPTGADFDHETVLPTLTQKAVEYIDQRKEKEPFFIYFPLPAPHTPILPTSDYQGKSNTNEYGDFVLQVDGVVGQIESALESNGIKDNTLIIFTSDNGCSPMADFEELKEFDHDPSHIFRGHKADIFEGGHRVPFIARWPEKIKSSSKSEETVCLTDLMATCAALVKTPLPETAGEDSFDIRDALFGKSRSKPIREATVHHSVNGSFSIRQGRWKLEMCPGSGGWSHPKPKSPGISELPPKQLYDLHADIGEKVNVIEEHPDVAQHLEELLTQYVLRGRSTPGANQKNDGPEWWPQLNWMTPPS